MSTTLEAGEPRETFVNRWLEPADRLAEAIYGLLILLTFTMAYQASIGGETTVILTEGVEVRGTLLAAIGCAVAWGLIDGIMYVIICVFERGERARVARAIQLAPSPAAALALIAAELDDRLGPLASADDRREFYERIYERAKQVRVRVIRVTREDVYGGIATVMVALAATMPAVLPFLFIQGDSFLALRLSNLIAIATLFWIGWGWARKVGARPLLTGAGLALLGVLMVIVAIPLGG